MLACQVSGGEVVVLVAPDADAGAVSGAVAALLTAAAASPTVRVVGGRAPIVPMRRRHGRRAVAAFSAGAAALAAAGVAAATNGVFTPDRRDRPSVSSTEVAAPPTTRGAGLAPSTPTSGGVVDDGLRFERRARSTSPTTTLPSVPGTDVQPDRQLATLGVGAPAVLTFDIPLPGEEAAPPVRKGPKKDVPVGPAPTVSVAVDTTVAETTTTSVPETTTTAPPTTTTLPSIAVGMPSVSPTTTWVDQHDNDRGERGTDSNGHDTKGPQREGWQRGRRG